MNEETLDKVLNLISSTDEMINLSNQKVALLHKLKRAVIVSKLLKDVEHKGISDKSELPENIRSLLKENNIKTGWMHDTTIKLFDNGAVEVLTSIKGVSTYIYLINDKIIFCID